MSLVAPSGVMPAGSRLQAMLGRGGWYALPQVAPALVRAGALPVMTRLLTPSGYGRTALWTAAVTMLLVGVRWTDDVLLRFVPGCTDTGRRGANLAAWAKLAASAAACATAVVLVAAFSVGSAAWFLVAAIVALEASVNSLQQYARALGRARSFAASATCSTVGTTLIALLLIPKLGAVGVLVGWICADAIALVVILRAVGGLLLRELAARGSRRPLRPFAAYGLPFIAATGSWMFLLFLDRLFVQAYHNSHELGLYSLAFSLVNTILYGLFMVIGFAAYAEVVDAYEVEGRSAAMDMLRGSLRLFYITAVPLALTVGFFARDALQVLAPISYQPAAPMVAPLVVGLLLQGLIPFTTKPLILGRRSRSVAVAAVGGTLLNVALNFALVPAYGGKGAGIATAISYGGTLVAVDIISRRGPVGRLPLDCPFAIAATISSASVIAAASVAGSSFPPAIRVFVVAPVAAAVAIAIAAALSRRRLLGRIGREATT